MSQDESLKNGGESCVTHIEVKDGGDMDDVVATDLTLENSELEIESYDEIYCPVAAMYMNVTQSAKDMDLIQITKSVEVSDVLAGVSRKSKKSESMMLTDVVKKNEVRRRSVWRIWGSRLGAVMMGLIVIVAVTLVGMRIAGFRTFTVMSGSMEPNYPVGAMIYVRPVDYQNLKVGDVISFVVNDDKTVVTHRIAEIEVDTTDATVRRFKTKGDANASADSGLVHYKNVLGTPIITIPLIGYFAHNIQQPPGIYIALVVGTLLLAWTFLPGTLEERRKTARKSVA